MSNEISSRKFSIGLILGIFMSLALIGGLLLSLPISSNNSTAFSFADTLFTSVSALSVGGLMVLDVAEFSTFGHVVLLILIQVGGLGLMTLATSLFFFVRQKISLTNKIAMQQAIGDQNNYNIKGLLKSIFLLTAVIEVIGALLLLPVFVPEYGLYGIFVSCFMAVSAFCNAGIEILPGTAYSLQSYSGNVLVLLTMACLVILGGIGFAVMSETLHKRRYSRLSLHAKIVLMSTSIILLLSGCLFLVVEWTNPLTLGNMNIGNKLLNAFFMGVTPRTAGFSTVEVSALTPSGRLLTSILMFVGASPASTGGGIKTTTVVVLIYAIIAGMKNSQQVIIGKRQLSSATYFRALTLLTLALALTVLVSFVLTLTESHLIANGQFGSQDIIFEAISAVSTAGMSTGVTEHLSTIGKIIVSMAMIVGRLGPLTVGLVLVKDFNSGHPKIEYPEGNIMIG